MSVNLGLEIRRLRKEKKIPADELSQKLGYADRQSVYDLEKKTKRFDFMLLKKLADIFEVEITHFFPYLDEKNQEEILQVVNENPSSYLSQNSTWKDKYLQILEENGKLKSKIIALQDIVIGKK